MTAPPRPGRYVALGSSFAAGGATVKDILRSSQFGQPAQITAVTAQTNLVTVTATGHFLMSLDKAATTSVTSRA